MVFNEATQLGEHIDAAGGSAGFDQAVPGVKILAKEDRLLQRFGIRQFESKALLVNIALLVETLADLSYQLPRSGGLRYSASMRSSRSFGTSGREIRPFWPTCSDVLFHK